jgi:DNA-binding MurR/RpiR family transcriptional regulator
MNKIISSHIQALKDTLRVLDDSAIEQAIKYILHANQLLFMGIGGAGSVAQDGQHKFMKIGDWHIFMLIIIYKQWQFQHYRRRML